MFRDVYLFEIWCGAASLAHWPRKLHSEFSRMKRNEQINRTHIEQIVVVVVVQVFLSLSRMRSGEGF